MQSHLQECLLCYRRWSSLQKTVETLRQLPQLEPPEHLSTRVMAGINERRFRQRPWWPRRWLPLGVSLAALLAVAVVLWQLTRPPLGGNRISAGPQESVAAKEVPAESPAASVNANKGNSASPGPVVILKVNDFSRADQQLAPLLRSLSSPDMRNRDPARCIRSSTARMINIQVPGNSYPHLIRELHKIGHLDHDQLNGPAMDASRHHQGISVRIVVVTDHD